MTDITIIETPRRKPKRASDPYKRRYAKNRAKKGSQVNLTRTRRGLKSLSKLQKELDAVFSRYVRYSRADKEGNAACYTCYHVYPVKKLHNGHYVLRGYKATRWDLDNCRPQCGVCNLWRKGEPVVFRENLVKELGEQAVLALEARRHIVVKVTREMLEALVKENQAKLSAITA